MMTPRELKRIEILMKECRALARSLPPDQQAHLRMAQRQLARAFRAMAVEYRKCDKEEE
jgi:hypothetical protein